MIPLSHFHIFSSVRRLDQIVRCIATLLLLLLMIMMMMMMMMIMMMMMMIKHKCILMPSGVLHFGEAHRLLCVRYNPDLPRLQEARGFLRHG